MAWSQREAQRLGRLGGKESARGRKGNSAWGRRAQRQRAAAVLHAAYPGLVPIWCRNAALVRWGRAAEVQRVSSVMTTPAIALRERRALERRRREYELASANGTLPAPSRRPPTFLEA